MRKLKKALTYILAAMVVIAVAALCVNIFRKLNDGDSIKIPVYPSVSSQTVALSYDEDDLVGYDIEDCTAKFVPNVTEGGEYDFEFTVGGESKLFSAETDLSGCFASDDYDGEGLAISADGAVSVNVPSYNDFDMGDILCVNYKYKIIAYPSDVDIYSYPYLALAVYLPSGTELCRTAVEFYTSDGSVIDIDSGETSYSLLSDCTEHVYDYDNIVYCWDWQEDENEDGKILWDCYMTYAECSVCGNIEILDCEVSNETVQTDGHWGRNIYTATVTVNGTDYTDTRSNTVYIGHIWNDGEVTTESTCMETGEIVYTCTVCGETKTEEIEVTGHSWDVGVEDGDGNIVYTCTVCGETKTVSAETTDGTVEETVIDISVTVNGPADVDLEEVEAGVGGDSSGGEMGIDD